MEANISGEWRQPINASADEKGGIHDDATASDLGFRGGTVAGAIHMEQFPPLLELAFGEDWWRTGTLSLYFNNATVDREPVRCFVSDIATDGDVRRASVWMEREDGDVIVSGTASTGGHDAGSALRLRLESIRDYTELRILADLKVGDQATPQTVRVADAGIDNQLRRITEPLDCYRTSERFGGRVVPYTGIVGSYVSAEEILAVKAKRPFVGLYGAIEIEYISGPVLSETDYLASGETVGLSESPRTEILWRDLLLTENGAPVARMLKMDRIMKDSSPLWKAA